MAQAMGLHRDGSYYSLRPIEMEVRRRLWAQICMLDMRFAEELGCEPAIMMASYDACLPLSISDDELSHLESQQSPAQSDCQFQRGKLRPVSKATYQELCEEQQERSPFSPMTFSLVRFE